MRTKILAGIAAVAIAASSIAITPAQARWHHHWHHGGWGGPLAGFAAGAIVGGALAAQEPYDGPYYGGPAYAYAPGPSVAYCEARFKSYNPATGLYLGYDGSYHPCP